MKKYDLSRPKILGQFTLRQLLAVVTCALVMAGVMGVAANTALAATACYRFSSLAAGSVYLVGDVINGANTIFAFKRFQWDDGIWTANGEATVVTSNEAAGSPPKELNLNNIMVRIIPSVPADGARYPYADCGGNVNFGVNGDFRERENLIALDGTVVGNCDISVTQAFVGGCWQGTVEITPQTGITIEQFGVGGQEFYVDDVCYDW